MIGFHARCWLCLQSLALPQQGICSFCLHAFPSLPHCCPCCGLPSQHDALACGRCQLKPPPWQQMIFVSDYQPPLNQLILQLKYHGSWSLAPCLARLLLLYYLVARRTRLLNKPDILTIVPLHWRRQWQRGYNQCDLLARPLAHWLQISYQPKLIKRQHATTAQKGLSAQQRRRNLRGSFCCQHPLQDKTVLLLDDVVTTGSTIGEISRLLVARGAQEVQILCLCRTL